MVKRLISVICVIVVTASSIIFCSCGNTASPPTEGELLSPSCTHDENYTEPYCIPGKYYLNGDSTSYYFEVTETTIELCGIDLSELYDSWQAYDNNEDVDDELLQQRISSKNEWIAEWTGPRSYYVKTLHQINDETILVLKETTASDNINMFSGLTIKDEKTLTGFGKDGDFVLVE